MLMALFANCVSVSALSVNLQRSSGAIAPFPIRDAVKQNFVGIPISLQSRNRHIP
jgi:hypothetical protein